MSGIAKTVALCVGFIAIVIAMFVFSKIRIPQLSEDELREQGVFILPRPRDLAPFELAGGFTNESLLGKWSFVFFGFTNCPDICPTSMAEIGKADLAIRESGREAQDGFQGVLVSVDPDRDPIERVTNYAQAFSPRFIGTVGTREALVELTQQVNVAFAKVPDDDGQFTVDHTGNIVIINPMGHYHGFMKLPHDSEIIRLTYQSLAARF